MKLNQWSKLASIFVLIAFNQVSFAEANEGPDLADASCSLKDGRIVELNKSEYVQIAGIQQWISTHGKSCSNPIVLMVHGGPGNPLSLYHDSLFRSWENDFTIVHWDQRGSGRTFEANHQSGELSFEELAEEKLSIDQLVNDGLEVSDYIRERFLVDKTIISGTSWGAYLALKMAHTNPNSFHFYAGSSQLINYQKNTLESYQQVLSLALDKKDQRVLAVLEEIGTPPWTNPRSFGKLRRVVFQYESEIAGEMPELSIGKDYLADKTREAYLAGEEYSFIKFVGLRGDGMANSTVLDHCCTEFKLPVYLLQGESDLLSTPKVTTGYFEKLKAPAKKYIQVSESGHDLNNNMLDALLNALKVGMASKN